VRPRRLVPALVFFAAAGCAAYGLLALGGAWSEWLDVLTHFAPIACAGAALVLAAALVLTRGRARRASVALAAAGLLSAGGLVAPELAAAARAPEPAPPGAERLRVLQFNVRRTNADPRGTAAFIRGSGADVVVLQEAYAEAGPIAEAVRDMYPHQATCRGDLRPCGTRVLSRRRPLARGGLHAPHDRDGSVNAAWLTLPLRSGGYATVAGTHSTWPIPAGAQGAQRRALARHLRRFDRERLIVAGDFNATPWSFALRRQDRLFGLERRTRALFSWPRHALGVRSPLPLLPIDHVYAGAGWSTVTVRRGPGTASDHYPVIADLALRPVAAGPS